MRLLWQSGGTGGAMTPANGGLKYPRSRGAWQIRLKRKQTNGENNRAAFLAIPLSMGKQRPLTAW